MSGIQDAINQAQAHAADVVANEANLAATDLIEGHVASSGQMKTFVKPTMTSVAASTGLLPRSTIYLKPTEHGMKIGKNKEMLQEFEAEIDLTDDVGFMLKHTIRFGNPAQYLSSYDGSGCNKGGTWGDALQKGRMAGKCTDPYFAAEIKLVLTKDLKMKEETLKAGAVVSYDTSSPSRFSDWSYFYDAAAKAGLVGQKVRVKVIAREINHNGNNWGTVSFEIIG
ncbi:MAG: hypothetical protein HRU33_00750 [Rhodobacteraceae bacterium]|nr:hypothetical protein [Paracoccaceae bacterium]